MIRNRDSLCEVHDAPAEIEKLPELSTDTGSLLSVSRIGEPLLMPAARSWTVAPEMKACEVSVKVPEKTDVVASFAVAVDTPVAPTGPRPAQPPVVRAIVNMTVQQRNLEAGLMGKD